MNFFDFALSTVFQVTKKSGDQLKILLHDDLRYPCLGKDDKGFVLHLAIPKRFDKNHAYFQGLKFNLQNPLHRQIIWYLFKASVYHLSLHSITSDFAIYSKWARGKRSDLATFTISLVEDAIINERIKQEFPWMLPETVYANVVSFIRMKNVECLPPNAAKAMALILMSYNLGKVKGALDSQLLEDVASVISILRQIKVQSVEEKLEIAKKIYDILAAYGETHEIPSLLHMESHGSNSIFYEWYIPTEEEMKTLFQETASILGADSEQQIKMLLQSLQENEAQRTLTAWQERENFKAEILNDYIQLGKNTPFENFEFPVEDYSEFMRKRELLSSPIRRILHMLRLLKNLSGEDFRQESGFVDLQEAIQVIASKSQRTDIFTREELQTREDAWSILIDASHSLNMFHGEVRGIALCLAEVARTLILDPSAWGMYAFNNKFYVVKDFSERYNSQVRARIGGLSYSGLTYLPDAVMLASQALTKRLEEAKVLVIVSDFFPSGYEGAEERLRENLRKIERMGIGIIGIGVNSRAVRDYIRTSCVVENPYDLMKKFTKAFMEFSSS